jgi:hypothetical protein
MQDCRSMELEEQSRWEVFPTREGDNGVAGRSSDLKPVMAES